MCPYGAPCWQIHFETTIYFQHVAKYLPLKSPINVLVVVVCFFFCLFSFLTFITSLEAFVAPRHSSGTKMLVPRRPVDIRGTPLIYNLTTAQPMRGYTWHIVKNSCISWWDKLLLTRILWWKTGPKKYIVLTDSRIPQMRSQRVRVMWKCFINYEQPRDCKLLLLRMWLFQRHRPGKQGAGWFERTN